MHVTHFFYELIFARESAGKKATFLGVWGEDGGGGGRGRLAPRISCVPVPADSQGSLQLNRKILCST